MTDRDTHSTLVKWMAAVTGKTVIKAHQATAEPTLPYIMINFTGSAPVRQHTQIIEYTVGTGGGYGPDGDDPPAIATPVIEMEWRYSVHAYGGASPTELLEPVISYAKLNQVLEPMFPSLVISDISQIRNVPDWINNEWQPRAQMDLFLRGLTRYGHIVDVIDQAVINPVRA